MKKRLTLMFLLFPMVASAHGPHAQNTFSGPPRPPKNARVIEAVSAVEIRKGMKRFASGLGVKCARCHDEEHYAADASKAKLAARAFLNATIGAPPGPARDRALTDLKVALGLSEIDDETEIWSAVEGWKRRKQR